MRSIELPQALAAAMSLRLPGTVGKVANKLRYIDAKGPQFVKGGLIRRLPVYEGEKVHATGISARSKSMPAMGGVLYGVAALRHDVVLAGNSVVESFQDSRVDINDMNYLETTERLAWKEFKLVYQLLTDLMESDARPAIILIDIPLLVPRSEQSQSMDEPDVEEEWRELTDVLVGFWQRYMSRLFPNDPNGPILVSLQSKKDLSAAVLHALREKGSDGSPDPVSQEAIRLVQEEWVQLSRVGILRLLKATLRGGHRTAAYHYEALGRQMRRFEPKLVAQHGLVGMHIQVGLRTPVWKLETIGAPGQWTEVDLDRLASLVAFLTPHDNPLMKPLPLWYAQKLSSMPREFLINYLRSALSMLKDRAVDSAWLEGLEQMEEE